MTPDPLADIRNFLPLTDQIGTAGQPTAEQFDAVRSAGYHVVINLALPTSTHALPDERRVVEAQGMRYLHIPVDFDRPAVEDARRFFQAMDQSCARNEKVFVHCAMNMRVSAFVYLYRVVREHVAEDQARRDLHRVWEPNETWQRFINEVRNSSAPS